ncbi:MAG TPA: cupin [Thermoanaerobaculia bacterium]|nr:cupin [Thermoanaerobaculia bacterium]
MHDPDCILKSFDAPTERREFTLGKFEVVQIAGMAIGRATYQPGWKWSEHVGPTVGLPRCTVEHVGLVLQGAATVAFDDGRIITLQPGMLFHVSSTPHDSWVVGDEPYVSLHFLNADHYAASQK